MLISATIRRHLLLLFFGFMATAAFAQADRFMLHGGFMYENYGLKYRDGSRSYIDFWGFSFGTNYVLMHSNDQFSLGVNPNATVAFQFSNVGSAFMFQAPVFLLARAGANSTNYNEQRFGIGAGAGAVMSYLSYPTNIGTARHWLANPSLVGEVSWNSRGSAYLLRVHWSISPSETEFSSVTPIQIQYSNFGVGLIYGF